VPGRLIHAEGSFFAEGVFAQYLKWDDLKRAHMRGVEIHARSASFVVGLKKPARAQAPSISLLKSLEAVCGRWGREIVSDVFRESEELRCHDRADRVAALIRVTGVAGRVSEKTGQRFTRTGLQRVTKYVDGGVHSQCHMICLPLEPEHVESSGVFGGAILVWLTFEPLMFSPGITRRAIRATGRLSLADRGLRPPGRARPVRRRGADRADRGKTAVWAANFAESAGSGVISRSGLENVV